MFDFNGAVYSLLLKLSNPIMIFSSQLHNYNVKGR